MWFPDGKKPMTLEPKSGLLPLMAAVICACVLPASLAAQQDAPAQQPADTAAQTQTTPPAPAPGPVGGVEEYRLDAPNLGRSFLVPRLTVSEVYDTNTGYGSTTGSAQSDEISTLTGGLSLQLLGRNSTFSIDANSTGLIYAHQRQPNSSIETLGVTEKLTVRRWNLLFGENFSYLPNSGFGLGGLGFVGGGAGGYAGVGGVTGFSPGTVPIQGIGSTNASQFSSASVFQAQYLLNGNSSFTGSVVVSYLHYFESAMLDSRQIAPRVSYDYGMTKRDTLTFSYQASLLDYASGIPGFTSHYFQVGYRRLLTGRLNFSVLAGPVVSQFSPFTGMTTVPGGSTAVSWSLTSSLAYRMRRGGLNFTYIHGVSSGSGVYAGTTADTVSGGATLQFSRDWSGSVSMSFARNQTLEQTTPNLPANTTESFIYWNTGGTISRHLGRYSTFNFNYNASRQTGATNVCLMGIPCGPIALVQVAGISISWSTRPLKLE